ncbi:MAG: hypothetical protein EOP02_03855 [Proteobacteria bacterium]|nr:MAG: hypothetical protein EOP02_03855 [Pseudomonadota bacterium]
MNFRVSAIALWLLAYVSPSIATEPFAGTWAIDLRTPAQRQRGVECGTAEFVLKQVNDSITGIHTMATSGCGRLNEGSSVRGVAVGTTAVLIVTSGRNGAIVMGTAKLSKKGMEWRQVEEIKAGNPDEDSPLILSNGSLARLRE